MTNRRDFLLALGAGALTPALLRAADLDMTNSPLRGVGIQIYMLRKQMAVDPDATLARVAALGYREVEWWGNWQRTPTQARAMLDANGLRAPAAHLGTAELASDKIDALIEQAAVMGHRTLIVASLSNEERASVEALKRTAALLNAAGAAVAKAGLKAGFHNHNAEFVTFGDRTAYDVLMAETDPSVVDFELDCYWAFRAGQDPLALLRRYRDRIAYLHLKDSSGAPQHTQLDLGAGVIDWRALLATGTAQRVTSVFLDQDDPADALASAGSARAYLRRLGY